MRFRLAALALLTATQCLATDPPPPDLKNPVDYIAWVNAEFSKGIHDNAADLYRQTTQAFVWCRATEDAIKDKRPSEWTNANRRCIRAWIEANATALRLFEQAAQKRDCFLELAPPQDGALMSVETPELSGVRNAAKLLAKRSYLELLEGRDERAIDDAVLMISAANHLQTQPLTISYLTGTGLRSLAYDLLLGIPQHSQEEADYAAILQTLHAHDPALRNPERQFAIECVAYLDAAQRHFKDTDGDGKLDTIGGPLAAAERACLGVSPMTLDEFVMEGETYFAQIRRLASLTPKDLDEECERLMAELKARGIEVVTVVIPSLSRCVMLYHRSVVQRSAVRIVLGAYAFRAKNGRWPRDLEEATADESPDIRKDPFSGRELVFRLEGDSFLLYSVGGDFNDDGGKRAKGESDGTPNEEYDAILWPLRD